MMRAMPKTKTGLTPAEYAVLGLLCEEPSYGYELKDQLSPSSALGRVCPVEPAMVYAILRSLTGFDLIDGAWDETSYPRKAVYTVTDEGAATFERWIRRPVGRIREVRHDFLIKLYFAMRSDGKLARELLTAQIAVTRDYAAALEAERAALDVAPADFDALVLDSRVSAARITLDWLEESVRALSPKRRESAPAARAVASRAVPSRSARR
jgi:DNA-binding PadR family transcriptional regulator